MTVHRVMGIETEYGIALPGRPNINSMLASSQVVNAYANYALGDRQDRARWDYDEERPLRDARGYDMTRAEADPSQLTNDDLGMANLILTNGARLYVDHAHPEYSSPEVTNPLDAMLWDKAGERIMSRAASLAAQAPGGQPLQLYKNNTDNKGASYGCHENYLMDRRTPFANIVSGMTPFFVSRQIVTGSGRVGIGQESNVSGFQLTQRADFFEVEVGLETTIKRPIINTRDEPHADPEQYRRLHVIVGDANLSQTSTYLKMGITSLTLAVLEAGELDAGLMPIRPVDELHAVSRDLSLSHRIELRDGRSLTALEMQWEFHEAATKHVAKQSVSATDWQTHDVLDRWADVLDRLKRDPMSLAAELDWVAKKAILEGYRKRDSLGWDASRLQLVDLQYSDIRSDKGLANRLEAHGRLKTIVSEEQIQTAVAEPPTDTRAWFRGKCIQMFGESIAAASWDSVIFDIPGRTALQRIPTLDPLRGTQSHIGELLARTESAAALVEKLKGD
jgi:proteasome accessory factor PafA2